MSEAAENFTVKLGGNQFVDCRSLITFDDASIFALTRRPSDDRLLISFDIYDECGQKVAAIRNNSVVYGDPERYEVTRLPESHTVKEKATGRVLVEIRKSRSHPELEVTVETYLPGTNVLLQATPDELSLPGQGPTLVANVFQGLDHAIAIGEATGTVGVKRSMPSV